MIEIRSKFGMKFYTCMSVLKHIHETDSKFLPQDIIHWVHWPVQGRDEDEEYSKPASEEEGGHSAEDFFAKTNETRHRDLQSWNCCEICRKRLLFQEQRACQTQDSQLHHESQSRRRWGEPRVYPCKFFLTSVNFYRFNTKNWHFRQILREKVAFFTDLTRKIGVFRCKFYSPKILPV